MDRREFLGVTPAVGISCVALNEPKDEVVGWTLAYLFEGEKDYKFDLFHSYPADSILYSYRPSLKDPVYKIPIHKRLAIEAKLIKEGKLPPSIYGYSNKKLIDVYVAPLYGGRKVK